MGVASTVSQAAASDGKACGSPMGPLASGNCEPGTTMADLEREGQNRRSVS